MDKERQWIRKIQRNLRDPVANKLIRKYYNEIYAFNYKQTLDAELSLDLTQEVFIHALKSIKRYDSTKSSFRTWIYKLASNRLIDYYRSNSYKYAQNIQSIEDDEFEDRSDMEIFLEYKEDVERVTFLINQLNAKSQQILRLKLFGDYTLQEIASIEMIPLSTVKTRYYAALRWIREEMKEENRG